MNEELLARLSASPKYRQLCPDTLRRAVDYCADRYAPKELEKAVRRRLHGITSAFMTEGEFKRAMKLAETPDERLPACHASTRERLPLERAARTYDALFSAAPPGRVLDLACGLNPLLLKLLRPELEILGCDISGQCVQILRACGIKAKLSDVLSEIPEGDFDTVLLFKILPLLEREEAGSAKRILERVPGKTVIVSFPTRTLSGRNVGMEEHYEKMLADFLPERLTLSGSLSDDNEIYYILKEKPRCPSCTWWQRPSET